jgi:hypothetical protein
MADLTKIETDLWYKGHLKYGLFIKENIPFFLLDFGGGFCFDMSFNILKIKDQEIQKTWLNSEANAIKLVLVEKRTFTVKALRLIGISYHLAGVLKSTLRGQKNFYKNADEVEKKIQHIYDTHTTKDLIKNGLMFTL